MNRRIFLSAIPATLALAVFSQAEAEQTRQDVQDVLANAFNRLSPSARLVAQERLSVGGFYNGKLDGSFGPRTRSAALNAAAFIQENSYGRVSFDLTSARGAADFLSALSSGDLDKYLWGEADESEGG